MAHTFEKGGKEEKRLMQVARRAASGGRTFGVWTTRYRVNAPHSDKERTQVPRSRSECQQGVCMRAAEGRATKESIKNNTINGWELLHRSTTLPLPSFFSLCACLHDEDTQVDIGFLYFLNFLNKLNFCFLFLFFEGGENDSSHASQYKKRKKNPQVHYRTPCSKAIKAEAHQRGPYTSRSASHDHW